MEAAGIKLTDVAQLAVSIVGFGFVWYQVRQLSKAVAGDAYTSLYEQYADMGKLFLERPNLRPYFYDERTVDEKAPDGKRIVADVEIMAELMTGLLEHAALQQDSMPTGIYKECWHAYTEERFKSPALRAYWQKNRRWYARDFQEVVEDILKRQGVARAA